MRELDLSKKADIEKLFSAGEKVYGKIKNQYESKYNGRYLAIDPESKQVYMGKDCAEALVLATKKQPDKLFFILKVGFDVAETSMSPILI